LTLAAFLEAALKLGVIPALALFLVVSMHLQNRQLLRDRKEMEVQMLQTLSTIVKEYQDLLRTFYATSVPNTRKLSRGEKHD
jgi:hypothetical protein